jgi:tetratricopeptide (TPR) repeat protein
MKLTGGNFLQAKKNAHYIVVVVLACVAACSSPKIEQAENATPKTDSLPKQKPSYLTSCKEYFREASKMDSILLQQNEVDKPSANKAIKAFTDFVYNCQSDSMSPIYLIKTAQVAKAIDNIPQAKLVLDKCIEDYPSFKDRAVAMFLLAQLYDENTYLNNENEARKLYQQILDEYPKSSIATSAKGAIKFIGKTDEEIMRELTKKKK